jgi:entry exclusion lipoprotein TrbK
MNKEHTAALAVVLLALLAGCDNKPAVQTLPEVNDVNCQIEKIKQIKDKAARQEFAGQCSHRTSGIAPTKNPKNWLELTRPDGGK